MMYAIIQPPFTLRFREMPKAELKAYRVWFMSVLQDRVAELEAEVRRASQYSSWRANSSPESLVALGEWFIDQVETRPETRERVEGRRLASPFPIDESGEQLTDRTFSLAMDIGMYFSEVVLKNVKGTRWDQPFGSKNFVDYGQPVLMGFGSVPLNPIWIVVSLAYGISMKKRGGARLRQVYDTWVGMARS